MRFAGGWLTLGRWGSVPLRFHWTTPLGALIFGGFRFAPGLWLGVIAVIVIHEIGHAVLVRSRGLTTTAIKVHGFGGVCEYAGWPTPLDRSIIAWGGVLAQAVLLVATVATMQLAPTPTSRFAIDLTGAFVRVNAILIALNLLPVPGLDGWEAWRLFGRLSWRKLKQRLTPRREVVAARTPDTSDPDEIVRRALERARQEVRARRKDHQQ